MQLKLISVRLLMLSQLNLANLILLKLIPIVGFLRHTNVKKVDQSKRMLEDLV